MGKANRPVTMLNMLTPHQRVPSSYSVKLPLIVAVFADSPGPATPMTLDAHAAFEGGDVALGGQLYERIALLQTMRA